MPQQLIPGITMNLGGREFVIPPLNLARVKNLQGDLAILATMPMDTANFEAQQLEACITIIHTALTRNYPAMARDEVEDIIDMGNMHKVMLAVMGQSGFTQGEVGPVTGHPLTGTQSTPT